MAPLRGSPSVLGDMSVPMQDLDALLPTLVRHVLMPLVGRVESLEEEVRALREAIGGSIGAPSSKSPNHSVSVIAESLSTSALSQSSAPVSPDVEHSSAPLRVGYQSRRSDVRRDGSKLHVAVPAATRDLQGMQDSNDDEESVHVWQGLGPKKQVARRTAGVRASALASSKQSTVLRWTTSVPQDAEQRLTAAALAAMPPAARKRAIGEKLYWRIYRHKPEVAGKLTGMMLELSNSELLLLLRSDSNLLSRLDEAMSALRTHRL
eukprot:TRINITY_DN9336_c0_g2_i1.p1 TRINITY_DN9336_c0_g2~~TRINITY_DN9336_c0_g2_i1.p1  ORF type:complete len:300 (+),score=47.16 TRINITY_DN9336_c0_g2_i1:111-902(+)